MRQQIHRSALSGGQTEADRLERAVQTAFVNAPSALPCRPEPRAVFDNAARTSGPARPWRHLGVPLRATCAAASAIGGPAIDRTRELVIRAVLAFLAWVLEPLNDGVPLSDILFATLVKEQAEALEAQALARGLETDAAITHAVEQTEEAILAQRIFCAVRRTVPRWQAEHRPITYAAATR
jgi:hypothetical protein